MVGRFQRTRSNTAQIAASSPARKLPPRPDYLQLKVFVTVTETGSFVEAGRQMGRTQPAISQAIARLEDIFGGDLFERRRGAGLKLTAIGEALLPSVRVVLNILDEQMQRAASIAQGRDGSLNVGVTGLAGGVGQGVAEFRRIAPHAKLTFVEGSAGDLYRKLVERRIDLLIGSCLPALASPAFEQEQLWQERLGYVFSAATSLDAREAFDLDHSTSHVILAYKREQALVEPSLLTSLAVPSAVERHDVCPMALLDLVAIGMGVTIAPASMVAARRDLVWRAIDSKHAVITIHAIWPAGDRNPLRHRLLACMRRQRPHDDPVNGWHRSTAPEQDRG